jgi:hypothetical protein
MFVEQKLRALGLSVPDLEEEYRTNPAGARFVSHVPVGNVLHLAGSVPLRDGAPFLTGVLGQELTVAQGYEAARYATLTTLSILKYALKDHQWRDRSVRRALR